jgi:hypothetical protein
MNVELFILQPPDGPSIYSIIYSQYWQQLSNPLFLIVPGTPLEPGQ